MKELDAGFGNSKFAVMTVSISFSVCFW
jgi:hypothetical protein